MKVSSFWGICTIILLLLLIGYYWRFSIIHNTNYEPYEVNIVNKNDGTYIESKAKVDVGPDYVNKNVKSVDNKGHFSNTDDNLVVHSNGVHKCISPATYDSSLKACACPPGFAYSTVLGCLSECDFWQTFVTDGNGGGSCKDVCPDPNQYLNSELPNTLHPDASVLRTSASGSNTNGVCTFCPFGYQTDNQNNCIPLPDCPVGTKYSDNTGNCIPYSIPVIPVANTCKYYQLDNSIASNNNADCTKLHCTATYPNGKRKQYYDLQQQKCVDCPVGYSANEHNICVINSECPDGFKMDSTSATGCVSVCTQSWEQWDTAAQACVNKCTGKDIHGYLNQKTVFTTVLNTGTGVYDTVGSLNNGFNTDSCSTGGGGGTGGGTGGGGGGGGGGGVNPGGINDMNTYTCTNCPDSFISDGANGCKLGPTPPAPTCEPGYDMVNGVCSLPCTDWRKYDINTDSCELRCKDLNNHWETNKNGTGQCVACVLGFTADADNNCTVKIPIKPVMNTPVPSCAPGSYSYIDPNTEETKCKSVCPVYTKPDPIDPTVCNSLCVGNLYYDGKSSGTPAGSGCVSCGNGYLADPDNNTCAECDTKVQYLKPYSQGTLTYTEVAAPNDPDNKLGYTCNPTCDIGYMMDDQVGSASFNTCYKCDTKTHTNIFVQNYTRKTAGDACVANCIGPNALDPSKPSNDPNPCTNCITDYSNLSSNPVNPKGWGITQGAIGRCVPSKCNEGFIIGSDYTCSECAAGYANNTAACNDVADDVPKTSTVVPGKCFPTNCPAGSALGLDYKCSGCPAGQTNKTSECTTLGSGVTKSATSTGKCFPKTCPAGSALGADYTCSACPAGQIGSAGSCTAPSAGITINSITNVTPANPTPTIDPKTLAASEPSFTCTVSLSVSSNVSEYIDICDSANISLSGGIKLVSSTAITVDLTNVKVTSAGIALIINYYSSLDKSSFVSKENYTLSYTISAPTLFQNKSMAEQPDSDATDYIESIISLDPFTKTLTPQDFAVGYVIVGGGYGGSSGGGDGGSDSISCPGAVIANICSSCGLAGDKSYWLVGAGSNANAKDSTRCYKRL